MFLENLIYWYNSKTTRQRNILRLTAFILAALPMIGWFFITPWIVPLMLYLEFHLNHDEI